MVWSRVVQSKDGRGHRETGKETSHCVISGFPVEAAENCALLACYVESRRNFLSTFRDNLWGPVSNPEDGTDILSRNVGKKLPLLAA